MAKRDRGGVRRVAEEVGGVEVSRREVEVAVPGSGRNWSEAPRVQVSGCGHCGSQRRPRVVRTEVGEDYRDRFCVCMVCGKEYVLEEKL